MLTLNLPFNEFTELPDCPRCKKGKLMYVPNFYMTSCTLCDYKVPQASMDGYGGETCLK